MVGVIGKYVCFHSNPEITDSIIYHLSNLETFPFFTHLGVSVAEWAKALLS